MDSQCRHFFFKCFQPQVSLIQGCVSASTWKADSIGLTPPRRQHSLAKAKLCTHRGWLAALLSFWSREREREWGEREERGREHSSVTCGCRSGTLSLHAFAQGQVASQLAEGLWPQPLLSEHIIACIPLPFPRQFQFFNGLATFPFPFRTGLSFPKGLGFPVSGVAGKDH